MLRRSSNSFMTKNLREAIMRRSKFTNCFDKYPSYENFCNYKIQQNFCISLLMKTRKEYFENLNFNDIRCNNRFLRTIKRHFNEKGSVLDDQFQPMRMKLQRLGTITS